LNKDVERINAIYCRVSTSKQKQDLENQAETIKIFCKKNGIVIKDIYKDKNMYWFGMGDYIDALYANMQKLTYEGTESSPEQIVAQAEQLAYEQAGFKRDSLDKVKERFDKEGKEYYKFLMSSKDKIVLSFEQYTKANAAAQILKTNRFTSKFLAENLGENIDRYYQKDSTFEYDGIQYKVKLDCIVVDHNTQTIHPIDIKTTSDSPYAFAKSMTRYRYDLQAVIYSHYISTAFAQEHLIQNYTIAPFKFIVINVEYPNNPLIWKMSTNDYISAKMGIAGEGGVRGLFDILADIQWHLDNNVWDYKREVYEKDGELVTNLYDKTAF
jgi:hypothetical protein